MSNHTHRANTETNFHGRLKIKLLVVRTYLWDPWHFATFETFEVRCKSGVSGELFQVGLLVFIPLCIFKCLLIWAARENRHSHWVHLYGLSPVCVFKCVLKLPAREDENSHWLHFWVFSPLCVFKCTLKWLAWAEAKSHWMHLFGFSPLCVFKCVLKFCT